MLLRPVLDRFDVRYATTDAGLARRDELDSALLLRDCNRHNFALGIKLFFEAWAIMRKLRPDVVVSTGAMPGLICILAGRLAGARTLWIDSVANSERLSGSGRMASYIATQCLTQWEHVSRESARVGFAGSLL